MTHIRFYEKPGCATNARQKAMLAKAGHTVEALSLLAEPWTIERLGAFFVGLPVNQWFNRASPRVKSGAVDPFGHDADTALALLIDDPLLIRRPLMEVGVWRCAGFDAVVVDRAVGLHLSDAKELMEGCSRGDSGRTCAMIPT
jgi:nitrogenase-associated protein